MTQRKTLQVDGLATGYLEAGQGDSVVLLHGGEVGVSADRGWENNIAALGNLDFTAEELAEIDRFATEAEIA